MAKAESLGTDNGVLLRRSRPLPKSQPTDGSDRQVDVPMEGIEADCYGEALEPAYDVQWVPVGIEKTRGAYVAK